jgi:TonB family protein
MNRAKLISSILLCLILLTSWVNGEVQERIIVQSPFTPEKKVYPDYPEILKKEGVPARFIIWINIDRKGNVTRASVGKSLYPELEENIEKAFAQWKFEPYIHGGEPIRIFGFMKVIFYPGHLSIPSKGSEQVRIPLKEESVVLADKKLQTVLDKCTAYCLKLSESALFYICHERIREKSKNIKGSEIGLAIGAPQALNNTFEISSASYGVLFLGDTERHTYINDYQLIKKEGRIKEKHLLMERDRKKVSFEDVPRGTKPVYSLKSILVPVQLLGIQQRSRFSFRLAEDDKIDGKPTYVIEVSLKPEQTGNIKRGKIWADKADFRVVKVEVETEFVEGYEHILPECYRYYLKPHFKSTHYYEIEKNDLLFPSRSEIRCEYSGFLRSKRELKSEVKITYGNYKFFTVETDHKIIKKKLETLFFYRRQQTFKSLIRSLPDIIRHF